MLTRRLLVPVAGSTFLLLALAGPASAHVTVQGPGATQGGFTKFTFRVPTEKDVATTKIEIAFPAEHPIASLRVKPHPGWTASLTKGKPAQPLEAFGSPVTEVVQRITWTAAPGSKGIAPDEFDEFEVSAGPLPETDTLTFKALQTYADGEVVRWIEEPAAGGEEPEHPAPTLKLAAATDSSSASAPASPQAAPAALTSSKDTDNGGDGNGLSIAALVVSGLALLTGLAALRRRRTA